MSTKTVFVATDPDGVPQYYDDPQKFYHENGYDDPENKFLIQYVRPNLWHYVEKNNPEKVLFTLQEMTLVVPEGIKGLGDDGRS